MKTGKFLCLLCVSALPFMSLQTHAQEVMNGDSLVGDFDYLVRLLETSHPDPYSGFGGKVFFHAEAHKLKDLLKNKPCTVDEIYNRTMTFLSAIRDGHTQLYGKRSAGSRSLFLPISFKCVEEGLIVREIPAEHGALLGSRLLGVNGRDMKDLLDFTNRNYVCENLYGTYSVLEWNLRTYSFIRQFLSEEADSVTFRLQTPNRKEVTLRLPFIGNSSSGRGVKTVGVPCSGIAPKDHLAYRFLDAEKQTMYLRLTEIAARDNIEFMYDNKWNFHSSLSYYYRTHMKQEVPADTLKAIQDLPSYTRLFSDMLRTMKKCKSANLVIDLRGNGGGWTPITLPTLYQLFGDEYLRKDMSTRYYTLISPLYLKKINKSLDEFNRSQGTGFVLGDYTFDEEGQDVSSMPIEKIRRKFVDDCISSDKKSLDALKGKPLYRPRNIYVLIDNNTFSAAFHYTFYLWKMGATVVGIPCRQAPNTFMEQTPFVLPFTHLQGSVSNSIQIFLPGNDRRAKTFYPDVCLTYDDYRKYNFDAQAEVLFILDYIKKSADKP